MPSMQLDDTQDPARSSRVESANALKLANGQTRGLIEDGDCAATVLPAIAQEPT